MYDVYKHTHNMYSFKQKERNNHQLWILNRDHVYFVDK